MRAGILSLFLGIFLALPVWAASPVLLKVRTIEATEWSQALKSVESEALYLVQWKEPIRESSKILVQKAGGVLLDYLPELTFLVLADARAVEKIRRFEFITGVLAYKPELRIDPELVGKGFRPLSEAVWVSVETVPGFIMSALQDHFSTQLFNSADNVYVGATTRNHIWILAEISGVRWVEEYLPFKNFNMSRETLLGDLGTAELVPPTNTGFESGAKVMNMEAAWSAGFNGRGEMIAFADTGLDSGDLNNLQLDFQGKVHTARALGLGGSSWADKHSHGTHVAGSIAGSGTLSDGLIKGAGWGAKLVAQGMWSDIMENLFPPKVEVLFNRAYLDGARIHSNSWGRPGNGRYDTTAKSVDAYMFEHQDFLAVFAAGNSGVDSNRDGVIDENSIGSPGTAKNALTVGASKNFLTVGGIQRQMRDLRNGEQNWGVEPIASSRLSEDPAGMAAFSSRGPTQDQRIKPDVVAPGTNIVSVRSTHPDAGMGWGPFGDHYLYMGGTSMSTPLVSGALGVVRQFLLDRLPTNVISAALMKATLINSSFDLFPGQFGRRNQGQEQATPRPNVHQGFGRVDLAQLVGSQAPNYQFIDERVGLAVGETKEWTVTAESARQLRITLAYSDAPGSPAAQKTLVNDLDLRLVAPDGTTIFPNRLSRKDNRNSVEHIDFLPPNSGVYRVIVEATPSSPGNSGQTALCARHCPIALVILVVFPCRAQCLTDLGNTVIT